MAKKTLILAAALPFFLCSCNINSESLPPESTDASTSAYTDGVIDEPEPPFTETMEPAPQENELSPVDPLAALEITPSDYFTPGVWTSTYTDDTGNFYIFDEDGIHGELIPMADAEGVDFVYSINGSHMTMYVGEERMPYNTELETTDEGHIIIHMTYLGTQDELEYLSGLSSENFTFYPAKKLAALAENYYKQQTGRELAGIEYYIIENDMVVLNLYTTDENGWRKDVESYTVSMFSAAGWSSISCEPVDLSEAAGESTEPFQQSIEDDIQDIVDVSEQF